LRKIFTHNPVLSCFIFTFILIAILHSSEIILPIDNRLNYIIIESVFIILILVLIKYMKITYVLQFNYPAFIKGLKMSWYVFVLAIINLLLSNSGVAFNNLTIKILLLLIVTNLIVGFFEEIICRGFIFTLLLKKYTPLKAAVISSLIFAFAHVFNYFNAPFLGTTSQIIYAFFFGICFSSIFYITKNIWSIALAHGVVDLASHLTTYGTTNSTNDATLLGALITIIISIPLLIIGLRNFKKANKQSTRVYIN
jgi:membrane protease YdiL (CAAX protease family)